MKPLGLGMWLSGHSLNMEIVHPTKTEDAVWDAVEAAIGAGWTVERFRREAVQAWTETLQRQAKDAAKDWAR